MNFTSEEDFEYVTGDLSSIVIDNDIMPVRTTEHRNDIRGIDIAFLMEAAEERRLAREILDLQVNTSFVNKLLRDQLSGLSESISAVSDNGQLTQSGPDDIKWVWYEGTPNEITNHALLTSYPVWLNYYDNQQDITVLSAQDFTEVTIDENGILEAQPIEDMFENVGKMKTLMRKSFGVYALRNQKLTLLSSHVKTGGSSSESFCQSTISTYITPFRYPFSVVASGGYGSSNTNYELAYYKFSTNEQAMNDWLPALDQCKDESGNFEGREVYGLMYSTENTSLAGGSGFKMWVKKISDDEGKVTVNSFMSAVNSIKNSGVSPWNFEPPYSAFTRYNDSYYSYIYISQVFIFDTIRKHTRWDEEE